MKRRQFLGVTIPGLLSLKLSRASLFGWGRVDIQRHLELRHKSIWLRVFVNGIDQTNHCRVADDRNGYAVLFKKNAAGDHYVDFTKYPYDVARETVYGRVEFKRVEPWA